MSALAIVLDTKLSSHSTPKPASVLDNGNLVSICLSLLRHLIRSQSGMHSTSLCAQQGTQWWAASIWWMAWVICSWRCCLQLFCSNATWPGLFSYLDGNYGIRVNGKRVKVQKLKVFGTWRKFRCMSAEDWTAHHFQQGPAQFWNFYRRGFKTPDPWFLTL